MTDRPRVWTLDEFVLRALGCSGSEDETVRAVEWDRDRTVAAIRAAIEGEQIGPHLAANLARAIFDALDGEGA